MEVILNSDQQKAIKQLKTWFNSPKRFIILEGAAGTGKTFLVKHFIKEIKCEPLFTAPSNEACRQLEEALGSDVNIMTTYAALGFHFDTTKETEELVTKGEHSIINDIDLIVVDEASMCNEKLLTSLRDTDRKILFIGHRSQLPAVEQNLSTFDLCESIVFKQGFQTVTLTKPERNTGELFEFINSLERVIYEKPRLFSKQYNIAQKEVDIDIYLPETKEKLFEEQKKIICYSNNEVDKYNTKIRQAIFKTKHLADFEVKDRILLTKPVNFITRLNGLKDSTVVNKEVNVRLSANAKAMITKVDLCNIFNVPCYDLSVIAGGQKLQLYVPTDIKHFNSYKQQLLHDAYGMRTPKAKENAFRKYHFIMSLFANVKHSYAITTHRSQGMTIPEVFVNWGDINKCGNIVLKHKLLYVAASRSRDNLRIF